MTSTPALPPGREHIPPLAAETQHPHPIMSAALAELSTEALMREVQRRLDCQTKPDKRLILIGPSVPQMRNPSCTVSHVGLFPQALRRKRKRRSSLTLASPLLSTDPKNAFAPTTLSPPPLSLPPSVRVFGH